MNQKIKEIEKEINGLSYKIMESLINNSEMQKKFQRLLDLTIKEWEAREKELKNYYCDVLEEMGRNHRAKEKEISESIDNIVKLQRAMERDTMRAEQKKKVEEFLRVMEKCKLSKVGTVWVSFNKIFRGENERQD